MDQRDARRSPLALAVPTAAGQAKQGAGREERSSIHNEGQGLEREVGLRAGRDEALDSATKGDDDLLGFLAIGHYDQRGIRKSALELPHPIQRFRQGHRCVAEIKHAERADDAILYQLKAECRVDGPKLHLVGVGPPTHQADHFRPPQFQRVRDNYDRAPVQCRGFGYGSHLSFSDSISARPGVAPRWSRGAHPVAMPATWPPALFWRRKIIIYRIGNKTAHKY